MVDKWRVKPVVVEAMRIKWSGRFSDVINFVGNGDIRLSEKGDILLNIKTPKGELDVLVGDYIVKDSDGVISVYKPDEFLAKYERHLIWDENI